MTQRDKNFKKKLVFLCFDKSESKEINAFVSRKRMKMPDYGERNEDDLDIHIIYAADVSGGEFMTYSNHLLPTDAETEILKQLTHKDKLYIWGHGLPNCAYIPGAFYTEVANFIEAGVNKDNFSINNPLQINCEMCNAGRGGVNGVSSFAARLHAYLGKKGVMAQVSGSLRNIVIEYDKIVYTGLRTIKRVYQGLLELNIALPDSFYKHQEPGSKVSYAWESTKTGTKQVRKDTYRNILFRKFLELQTNLLTKLSIEKEKMPLNLKKELLAINLSLGDLNNTLDPGFFKRSIWGLRNLLINTYCLTENDLREIGFNSFKEKLKHQLEGDGLLKQETQIMLEQPLLMIEKDRFCDMLKTHPQLRELSDNISKFQQIYNKRSNDEHLKQFVATLKTEKDINDEHSLYSTIFTAYRKHLIVENDDTLDMPILLKSILMSTNKMLKDFIANPTMSVQEKSNILKTFRYEVSYFVVEIAIFDILYSLQTNIEGFFYGVRAAWKERHEGSIIEIIAQIYNSGIAWAEINNSHYTFFKGKLQSLVDEGDMINYQSTIPKE